jgi:hypothetical protein
MAAGALVRIPAEEVLINNISPGCTLAVRKDLVREWLTISDHTLPHDHELNIVAALRDELYFYNSPLIDYRIHAHNVIGLTTQIRGGLSFAGTAADRLRIVQECERLSRFHYATSVYDRLTQPQQRLVRRYHAYIRARKRCLEGVHPGAWLTQWSMIPFIGGYKPRLVRIAVGDGIRMMQTTRSKEEIESG